MQNIKLILWDLDGTILNFKAAQKNAIRACFEKFGLGKLSDDKVALYDKINESYWKRLELGEITKEELLPGRFVEFFELIGVSCGADIKTGASYVQEFLDEYQVRLGDTIEFFPGAMEKIEEFKNRGILQFLVTNGTTRAQTRKLSRSGLDKIFDEIFISDQLGFEKPSMKFFDAVWEKATDYIPEIKKDEILIIGDSDTSDMRMGIDAGICTCQYVHAFDNATADGNKPIVTDMRITDFSELVL